MLLTISPLNLFIGTALAALVSGLAWKARSLAPSGAWAAFIMGSLIFGIGTFPWASLLLCFFISSTLLSKYNKSKKASLHDSYAKSSRRDWAQVLANGGLGILLVLFQLNQPEQIWPWLAYAGALATVNADTWATELGTLAKPLPRLITTWKPVPQGTSGGVSIAGTTATLAGAVAIALVGMFFTPVQYRLPWILSISLAGLSGSLVDSFLGATLQGIFFDPIREKETEKKPSLEAKPIRGWAWMNNDLVNFLSAGFGALVAVLFWAVFS